MNVVHRARRSALPTTDGNWIAYAVSSRTQDRNGVFLKHALDGSMRTLLAGAGRYKGLAFDERGTQLAFISDRDDFHADASDGGQGMSRAFQYERGTGRMGGPPWERAQRFIENSPIFWVDKVTTPYLTIHNDEDDAVPWYQGIEFFSALRRLGKEAYMFNSTRHRIDGPIPSPSFYLFGSGLVAAGLGLERAPSGGRSQVYCRSRA